MTSTVFITEHLPKLFYMQKQLLMQQFKDAKKDQKDARFGAYNGQYCLYVDNKRILPPSTA